MLGSADVVHNFNAVLDRLDEIATDNNLQSGERDDIMRAVAVLTYHMRHDLLGQIEGEDRARVLQDIIANNADLEG